MTTTVDLAPALVPLPLAVLLLPEEGTELLKVAVPAIA